SFPLFLAFLYYPPSLQVSSSLPGVPLCKAGKDFWCSQPLPAAPVGAQRHTRLSLCLLCGVL
ncbi:hypothetical protein HGM15179_008551, partial [Zosterops borbonicus]